MEIGLTEVVRKMASVGALDAANEPELLFCWDFARVDFGPRKLLVASNVGTGLCAIARMAAADWRHLDSVACQLVADAVDSIGLDAEYYLELAGKVSFSKTHGRQALGCINNVSSMFDAGHIDMTQKIQWHYMSVFNCNLFSKCAGHDGHGIPAERFTEDFNVLCDRAASVSDDLQS